MKSKDKIRDREPTTETTPIKKSKKDKKKKKESESKDDVTIEETTPILDEPKSIQTQINELFDKITNPTIDPMTLIHQQLDGLNKEKTSGSDVESIAHVSQNLLQLYDRSLQMLKVMHASNTSLSADKLQDSQEIIRESYNSIGLNHLKDLMSVRLYQPISLVNNELKYGILSLTKGQTVSDALPTPSTSIDERFREFYMDQMATAFGDELDEIRQAENLDEAKIKILVQSLEIGIQNFSAEEKQLHL